MIDRSGRLFGRINLVDAAAIAFVVFLIPVGYATYLLFRPSRPTIDSVTRVEITREERRVAGGSMLTAKLKVRGSGFNPLLRARIGDHDTLGFVFENPNSADVLVGIVPPGKHDLVLYDGVQVVARAPGAVDMQSTSSPTVRAYGWITLLVNAQSDALRAGFTSDANAPGSFKIIAIGDARPARSRVAVGATVADIPVADRVERAAEILIECDWPSASTCAIGGQALSQLPPITVILPGGYTFQIEEIGPPEEPTRATLRVQLDSVPSGMKAGDRDDVVGARAAEVAGIAGSVMTIRAGADQSRDGWRYRGQLLRPGAEFTISTPEYLATGTVLDVRMEDPR